MSNVAADSPRIAATPLATPSSPRFEHRTDAGPVLGIGTATPRLSWQVPTAADGYEQTAYEVRHARKQFSERRVDAQPFVPFDECAF